MGCLITVEGVDIIYPFNTVSAQQIEIMSIVLCSMQQKLTQPRFFSLLESQTGSGKTVAILSALISFWDHNPSALSKIVFMCRTMPEINHVLGEMRRINDARAAFFARQSATPIEQQPPVKTARPSSYEPFKQTYLAIPLTTKARLCVNTDVLSSGAVDTECLRRTFAAQGDDTLPSPGVESCTYFSNLVDLEESHVQCSEQTNTGLASYIDQSTYDIDSLLDSFSHHGFCPYFAGRRAIRFADVIVCSYNYLLDPKYSSALGRHIDDQTVLVFDEAHNLEQSASDAMSMHITQHLIASCETAIRNFLVIIKSQKISRSTDEFTDVTKSILRNEKALSSLKSQSRVLFSRSSLVSTSVLPATVPKAVRSVSAFINTLLRICAFFRFRLTHQPSNDSAQKGEPPYIYSPFNEVEALWKDYGVDRATLALCPEILHHYMSLYKFFNPHLPELAQLVSLVATSCYTGLGVTSPGASGGTADILTASRAFGIIVEAPVIDTTTKESTRASFIGGTGSFEPTLIYRFCCFDPLFALMPVLQFFSSIFLMSGTILTCNPNTQEEDSKSMTIARPSAYQNDASDKIAGAGDDRYEVCVRRFLPSNGSSTTDEIVRAMYSRCQMQIQTSMFEIIVGIQRFAETCPRDIVPALYRYNVKGDTFSSYLCATPSDELLINKPNIRVTADIIEKGADQTLLTSKFIFRTSVSAIQNYAKIILDACSACSDGVVVFFPSYRFMEDLITVWHNANLLSSITANKLIFLETPDPVETTHAIACYRRCCDNGRGAVMFCIARGKISEGIDFKFHYGRICVMIGIPYIYSGSSYTKLKLAYLQYEKLMNPRDYMNYDAGHVVSQCVGRVIRGENDYASIILADERYNKFKPWISSWIQGLLQDERRTISDHVVKRIREFQAQCMYDSQQDDTR